MFPCWETLEIEACSKLGQGPNSSVLWVHPSVKIQEALVSLLTLFGTKIDKAYIYIFLFKCPI